MHVYERGRGKHRREGGVVPLLRTAVARLQHYRGCPWLLQVLHGAEESGDTVVFVTERVLGTLSTILASQHGPAPASGDTSQKIFCIYFCIYSLLEVRLVEATASRTIATTI